MRVMAERTDIVFNLRFWQCKNYMIDKDWEGRREISGNIIMLISSSNK